ncbi:GtrA family protein [Thalassiella azotivora]
MTPTNRLGRAWSALVRQLAAFGAVGAVAFVVDVGLFNVLRFAGEDGGVLADHVLTAKVVSSAVATVVSWLGNRYWTFRRTRRPAAHHEFVWFVVMCMLGLAINLAILWFSHYVLGFQSALADNIAANVVGLGAGTLFRFWAYRRFVFTHEIAQIEGESPEQVNEAHAKSPIAHRP